MSETVNQGQNNQNQNTGGNQERTFTQAELDAILSDRISRERAKYADYDTMKEKAAKFDASEEASKSELQKAQERAQALQLQIDTMTKADNIRKIREQVAKETGVPANLLYGEDEESCKAQAKAIREYAKPGSYPSVQDGGEVTKPGGKKKTDQQFAEWANEIFQ